MPLLRRLTSLRKIILANETEPLRPGEVRAANDCSDNLLDDVKATVRALPAISTICLADLISDDSRVYYMLCLSPLRANAGGIDFPTSIRLCETPKAWGAVFSVADSFEMLASILMRSSRVPVDLSLSGHTSIFGPTVTAESPIAVHLRTICEKAVRNFIFSTTNIAEGADAAALAKLVTLGAKLGPACTSIKLELLDLSSTAANDFVSSFLLPGGGASVSTLHIELPLEPAAPLPAALVAAMPTFSSLRTLLLCGRLGEAPVAASFAAALAALPQSMPLRSLSLLSIDGYLLLEPLLAVPLVRRCAAEGVLRISFAVLPDIHRDKAKHLRLLVEAGATRLNLALQGMDNQVTYTPMQRHAVRKDLDRIISGFLAKYRKGESLGGPAAAAAACGGKKKKAVAKKPKRGGGATPAAAAAAQEEEDLQASAAAAHAAAAAAAPVPAPILRRDLLTMVELTSYEPAYASALHRQGGSVVYGLRFSLTEAECLRGELRFSSVYR